MTWLLKGEFGSLSRYVHDGSDSIKGGATILVYYCAQLNDAGLIAGYRKTLIGYFTSLWLSVLMQMK
ncbi:MAG: hypothetical protein ACEPO2_01440 [Pelagibaca sp.]